MTEVLVGVSIVVGVAALMLVLAWLARRIRRRGSAGPAIGAAMAAYDQGVHVTAYESFLEMQAQAQRATPMPAPAEKKRPPR